MKRKRITRSVISPAPAPLHTVQDFLNTRDLKAGTDELETPRSAADWLTLHGLLATGVDLDAAGHRRVVAFREALRALLAAGGSARRDLRAACDEASSQAALRARFAADGELRFEPVAPAGDGAIGRVLAHVAAAQRADLWRRFSVCASPECRAAFYDYSTNHSSKWCRTRCGNRISAEASRRRRKKRKARALAERKALLSGV